MPYIYATNNFNKALRGLAKAGPRKREWLASKYVEHICYLEISDIPDDVRDQFCQFRRDMKFVRGARKTRQFEALVRAMSDAEVDAMVARVVAMHAAIIRHEVTDTRRDTVC